MSSRLKVGIHRAAFLALCVVPTLLLMSWIAYGASEATISVDKSLWEEELSWLLGLNVRVEHVEQPELGRTVLYGVEVVDPEWGALGRLSTVELARTERGLELVVAQGEIEADRLQQLGQVLHDRVLRMRQTDDLPIHFQADAVTIASSRQETDNGDPAHAETLQNVEVWITSSDVGPQLSVTFQRAGSPESQPIQFNVVRKNREGAAPATSWSLDTQADKQWASTPLPWWLLVTASPNLAPLGDDCRFQGQCWGEWTSAGWQGQVRGAIEQLDLSLLVTRRFPHLLSGRADVRELQAIFRDGRVEEAQGQVTSGGGVIGSDFVFALCSHLPLLERSESLPPGKNWQYTQLEFTFHLAADGVRLYGANPVLSDARGTLVQRVPGAHAPILGLVRALVSHSATHVPATRETESLLPLLPIPSISPEPGVPPTATLRIP